MVAQRLLPFENLQLHMACKKLVCVKWGTLIRFGHRPQRHRRPASRRHSELGKLSTRINFV